MLRGVVRSGTELFGGFFAHLFLNRHRHCPRTFTPFSIHFIGFRLKVLCIKPQKPFGILVVSQAGRQTDEYGKVMHLDVVTFCLRKGGRE